MGWAGGSMLFNDVWDFVRGHIPEEKRVEVCAKVIEAFEAEDWDTQNESFSDHCPEVEEAFYRIHPDLKEARDDAVSERLDRME